jgi:hypothetical protein
MPRSWGGGAVGAVIEKPPMTITGSAPITLPDRGNWRDGRPHCELERFWAHGKFVAAMSSRCHRTAALGSCCPESIRAKQPIEIRSPRLRPATPGAIQPDEFWDIREPSLV